MLAGPRVDCRPPLRYAGDVGSAHKILSDHVPVKRASYALARPRWGCDLSETTRRKNPVLATDWTPWGIRAKTARSVRIASSVFRRTDAPT